MAHRIVLLSTIAWDYAWWFNELRGAKQCHGDRKVGSLMGLNVSRVTMVTGRVIETSLLQTKFNKAHIPLKIRMLMICQTAF